MAESVVKASRPLPQLKSCLHNYKLINKPMSKTLMEHQPSDQEVVDRAAKYLKRWDYLRMLSSILGAVAFAVGLSEILQGSDSSVLFGLLHPVLAFFGGIYIMSKCWWNPKAQDRRVLVKLAGFDRGPVD